MIKPLLLRQSCLQSKWTVSLRYFCFYYLLLLLIVTILTSAINVNGSSNSSVIHNDIQRDLSGVTGTEACANCTPEKCVSTTIARDFCNPCADGQVWWPCNLPGECYCSNEVELVTNKIRQENLMGSDACSTAACTSIGGKCVTTSPIISDAQCAACEDGKQPWWPCNVIGACTCRTSSPGQDDAVLDNIREDSMLGSDACSTAACTSTGGRCVTTSPDISDSQCAACEDGKQSWWPCNVIGACICRSSSDEDPVVDTIRQENLMGSDACSTAACTSIGGSCVTASPHISDIQCADCEDGKQSWWPCNVIGACICKTPTVAPTNVPTEAPQLTTPTPNADDIGSEPGNNDSQPSFAPTEEQFSPSAEMLEGMLVLDTHIAANKLVLARELLLLPSINGANANSFTFSGFRESLQKMILTPIMVEGKDPKTMEDIEAPLLFYIGDVTTESTRSERNNERVYGLVNVALFLASSYSSSLSNASCDEINVDIVDGFLPISNACGQHGMTYQDTANTPANTDIRQGDTTPLFCAVGDEKFACDVDLNMRARARPPPIISRSDASRPGQFYCAPKTDYNGSTGYWSFEDNEEIFQPAKQNRLGRTDVQG